MGDPGEKGDPGQKGDPAPTTGTLAGTVTDGVAKGPLADVAVTALDAGGATLAAGHADAAGKFSLTVPAGSVIVSFAKPFYTSPGDLAVGVGIGRTVTISVTMNEAAGGKPSLSLTAPGNDVGYGASVALTATATDPNGDPLTYSWSNATVPALGTLSGDASGGTLIMPTLAEAFAPRSDSGNPGQFISGYALENRFGILPIIGDTRGQVTVNVTVSDGRGQSASAALVLNAANVLPGVRNVAIGTRVYLNSGHDADNRWMLTGPNGSTAALDDPTRRTPSFVVDRPGTYTVAEGAIPDGGTTPANHLDLEGGDWKGVITGGSGSTVTPDPDCTVCHNSDESALAIDKFTPWLETGHATQFTRGINGVLGPHYSESCAECHTVGFDKGTANGGFDDLAQLASWVLPTQLQAGNWSAMLAAAPSVARLANIQCESCHGPQLSAAHRKTDPSIDLHRPFLSPRISYGSEACATCHGEGAHHIYSEWATPSAPDPKTGVKMAHSNRNAALSPGLSGSSINTSCGRCHTAQGYTLYVDTLHAGKVALDSSNPEVKAQMGTVTAANVEPVTCPTCHDPHDASHPNQLRIYGDTPLLPSGFAGYGMGKGALCLTCHNSRNGAQTGSLTLTYLHEDGEPYNSGNPTSYSAPHQACQGDVFVGHNAYFMGGGLPMTSRHAAVEDTCVGCHMTLQPKGYLNRGTPTASGHLFRIVDEDRATLCANCHGKTVDGEAIQAAVEAGLAALTAKLGQAAKTKINGIPGGKINLRAYDGATDLYSSTGASNVQIDVAANPVTAVGIEEGHGQIQLHLTFTNPVVGIQFVDGSGKPAGAPRDLQQLGVQLGALKDGQSTPAVLYALSGNFVRAGWNYFLVEGDQSKGLHNPSFVQAVLNSTVKQDLSN